MRAFALRKGTPVPLYYQLAELIRERIASGEFQPGDRLPSARAISDDVGISRMTVRQALDHLERQGHLVVRQGAGTFVAARKLTFHAVDLLGFTQEMIDQGRRPSSRVLEQLTIRPPVTVAESLSIDPDSPVLKISRLRLSQGVPVLLETVYLPQASCPGLEQEDLGRVSLYRLLEERYHLRPRRTRQRMDATVANEFEAELFGVPAGTPMLLMEGVTYGPGDQPIESFKAVFRGDRFQFEFESQAANGGSHVLARPVLNAGAMQAGR